MILMHGRNLRRYHHNEYVSRYIQNQLRKEYHKRNSTLAETLQNKYKFFTDLVKISSDCQNQVNRYNRY